MASLRRALLRAVSLLRAGRAEADLAREITAHLQLLEDRFVADGMSRDDARYAAKRAFGGVEQAKEHQRDARSFRWLDAWSLDLKLGVRMLAKSPGLTLVGGLGIAVAIAIAAASFSIIGVILDPELALPDDGRLVSLQNWDAERNTRERRLAHDFARWRAEVTSVEHLSAFRNISRNLIAPGGQPETVRIAQITASGFRVAQVSPLLGRYLRDEDEHPGRPPVLVIGYDVWQRRFAGDVGIVGRFVHLGDVAHEIVGVMPEAFAFPISHGFWVPMRLDLSHYAPRTGPNLWVFGRLAPGVSREGAQAELDTIGQRGAAALQQTHQHLRPQVIPYTRPFFDMDEPGNAMTLRLMQILMVLLLLVVSVNVAILVYARTARRHGEIAIRTALGASRKRIIAQLFTEALVLSTLAAAAGLGIAAVGFRELTLAMRPMFAQLPFWMDFSLSSGAVVYALLLSVIAAGIVGVVPAIKATGRRVQMRLQMLSGGGGSGMQLGRTWTLLIVAQVAFAVALLPPAVYHAWDAFVRGEVDPGFAASEYLTADLLLDQPAIATADSDVTGRELAAQYGSRLSEVVRRLKGEPGVGRATFAMAAAGQEPTVWIEIEGNALPDQSNGEASDFGVRQGKFGHQARFNRIDVDFFDAFEGRILTGRGFVPADADPASPAVIVNRTLAQQMAADGDVLGRRVRYVGRSGDASPEHVHLDRWYEVVGVVSDVPMKSSGVASSDAKLYHAVAPDDMHPASLALRLRGTTPAGFNGRLREIAAAVDPNLQLRNVLSMDAVLRQDQGIFRLVAVCLVVLTLSVVLLSAAGIYALMSFTVAQRRREIGIRAALGANPRRILAGVFGRALAQLTAGAIVGMAVAALLDRVSGGDLLEGHGEVVLPLVGLFITAVGLVAALGPARRGLSINPTEALRAE